MYVNFLVNLPMCRSQGNDTAGNQSDEVPQAKSASCLEGLRISRIRIGAGLRGANELTGAN